MAIDRGSVELWKNLKANGFLPENPSVLEIGEANWYGDVPLTEFPSMANLPANLDSFVLAKVFYSDMLAPSCLYSIDLNGKDSVRMDLNKPIETTELYDIVINTGTLEHVFNQRQAFETIHDATRLGGLMVHAFPVAGCIDHGFYTYSPCLIRELARTNNYELLAAVECVAGPDKIVQLAWRKQRSEPFALPYQRDPVGIAGGEFKELKGETI